MTKEQLEQLLKAVEDRVTKTIEPLKQENENLKKALDDVNAKFGEDGEITKALADIKDAGDQTLREIVAGTFDEEGKVTKAGLVQRLKAVEERLTTRKSAAGQEEPVTKSEATDPLFAAVHKAISNRGEVVTLGRGDN